jgi:hypothetical protein
MDLKDATLMMLTESADHPAVASLARSAYQRLANEEPVDYRLLDDLIREASGKGVLRALHAKYGPAAQEAIVSPILREIGRHKPIGSRRRSEPVDPESDPLRASTWPPRMAESRIRPLPRQS